MEVLTEERKQTVCPCLHQVRKDLLVYVTQAWPSKDWSGLSIDTSCGYKLSVSHLKYLVSAFHLSEFEYRVLLLTASVELDVFVSALLNRIASNFRISLSFARELYPDTASLVSGQSALRFWSLISLENSEYVLHSPLMIPEKVLLYLLGEITIDLQLIEVLHPVPVCLESLRPTRHLQDQCLPLLKGKKPLSHPIQLQSIDSDECEAAACYLAREMKRELYRISLEDVPAATTEQCWEARLIAREMILNRALLWVECDALITADEERKRHLHNFLTALSKQIPHCMVLSAYTSLSAFHCTVNLVELKERTVSEQVDLWRNLLDEAETIDLKSLQLLSHQFKLSLQQTAAVAAQWNRRQYSCRGEAESVLWNLCRMQLRRMETGVQWLKSHATLNQLALDARTEHLLQQFILQARNRFKVYQDWGFSSRYSRGMGLAALFSGPPGTGKTTAAEAIANALHLDLLQVELSRMVSKYIGETEKNLEKVFNRAHKSGAILLFDEADSLFNKRTAVKDSHDANANRQISYLLQKIETHQGITILTTNQKSAFDEAFLRRIRFVIAFEAPDRTERRLIWQHSFPDKLPVGKIDIEQLAAYSLNGSEIKNATLNAAFMAADENRSLQMDHLKTCILEEFEKNEKPVLTD